MSGYWWLKAKTYLRDRARPDWVNKTACVSDAALPRYDGKYLGAERALPLQARPLFNLDHRERRVLDLRNVHPWSGDLDPFFLLSADFAALIQSVDQECLHVAACDMSSHGRAPHAAAIMADTSLCVEGWTVFDRARSAIVLRPGFIHGDGAATRFVDVNGAVRFKPEVVGDRAMFRVVLGGQSRVVVSDALANEIFSRELLGIELVDASSDRSAPERYALYKTSGWESAYPA